MNIIDRILQESKLNELFDGNALFDTSGKFYKETWGGFITYKKEFQTESGYQVEVSFTRDEDDWDYEIIFAVQGCITKRENMQMSPGEYLKLINTVAYIVNEFISKVNPKSMWFGADDKKLRIYHGVMNKVDTSKYEINKRNGYTKFIRKETIRESMDQPESLFQDNNRYAFIWRDSTKFNTIEKKRHAVATIEKFRKKFGIGLPTMTINPQVLVGIQGEQAKSTRKVGSPLVAKLHGVYYLIDGNYRTSVAHVSVNDYIKVRILDLDNLE